jgi:hypothetical protein
MVVRGRETYGKLEFRVGEGQIAVCVLLARLVGDQGFRRLNLDCGLSTNLVEHEEKRLHVLLA